MRYLLVLGLIAMFLGCSRDGPPRREPAISQDGQVSLLTVNVAGLPDFLTKQDFPKERMYGIAHFANAYDVVAYQEDFYYSSDLDRHSRFANRERATKLHPYAFGWPWLRKSGLTIQTPWKLEDSRFHAFRVCKGYFEHGSDCWVPKGVMCVRTTLPNTVVMDICTTHFDAGSESNTVRFHQALEYLAFLPDPVVDEPYLRVELGDYNMRPHEDVMKLLMEGKDFVISERYGRENFVEFNEVDYIMVTSNEHLNVTLLDGGTAKEFTRWTDHLGVFALLGLEIVR